MRFVLLISFFVINLLKAGAQSPKTTLFDTVSFKKEMINYFNKLKLPGLSVAVVHQGKIIYRQTEGFADTVKRTPIQANSIFPVASITKSFTAVLLMKYAEEGRISLDDYLLDYPFNRMGWAVTSINPDVRLKHFLSQTSEGEPGINFIYNGSRFNYLYGVFEKISGQQTIPKAYFEELQKNILTPLHLTSTFSGYPDSADKTVLSRIVTPYNYDPKKGFTVDSGFYKNHDAYPGSALTTSIDDLVRYSNALDNNELISAGSYKKMTTPYKNQKGLLMPYGLGWFSETIGGVPFHWSYGFGDSHAALLIRVPEKRLTFIMLSNSGIPTGALRLGSGHLLHSPFAISFARHFVLAGQITDQAIDYNSDAATIEKAFAKFRPGKKDSIWYEQLIAEALFARFIETKMDGPKNKAKELLKLLHAIYPARFSIFDPTLLWLLADLSDEALALPMQNAIDAYKRSVHFHPETLQNIIEFHKKTNREEKALPFYHLLADSKGFETKGSVIEACAFLGRHYMAKGNVAKGRDYLWRSVLYAKQAGYNTKYIDERIAEMKQGNGQK